MMSIDEIKEMVEDREYDYIGLRIEENVNYEIGDTANVSRVWDNNELTGETLDGTCCIGMKWAEDVERAMEIAKAYCGDRWYLIAGNDAEYGEDDGEIIIEDATVVAIVK